MHTSLALLLALAASSVAVALPARADEAALAARVEKMQAELDALKAELQKLKAAQAAPPASVAATPAVPRDAAAASNDSGALTPSPDAMAPGSPFADAKPDGPALTVFGYGEANYENYPANKAQTQADLARAVIGFGYRFDERTRFVGEFEWEHAVTSADDHPQCCCS